MGFAMWGVPSEAEVDRLMAVLDVEITDAVDPHVSLVDFSRLQSIPVHGFGAIGRWLDTHHAVIGKYVKRQALVRPEGIAGSIVAGFYALREKHYPVEVFTHVEDAVEWLDRLDTIWLPAFLEDSCGELKEVAAIRAAVAKNPLETTIESVAKDLLTTERTLQRKLSSAGTSFRDELTYARIERAKDLLLTTSDPIGTIALNVGFASQSHFNKAFQQRTGLLPSDFRDQRT